MNEVCTLIFNGSNEGWNVIFSCTFHYSDMLESQFRTEGISDPQSNAISALKCFVQLFHVCGNYILDYAMTIIFTDVNYTHEHLKPSKFLYSGNIKIYTKSTLRDFYILQSVQYSSIITIPLIILRL
jgi:hypothetical protein